MNNENSLLTGKVAPTLLRFAIPFLAASFLQQLYSTVDMLVVGHLSANSAVSISAVSTGGQLTFSITSLIIGLATGGTVLIGQYMGANRKEDVSKTIGAMFPMFGIFGLAISLLMAIFTAPLISIMQVPAEAVMESRQYLFICAIGMVFVSGYNMVSGILRGLGDSKTPMILVAIACGINIIGDIILVGPLQMGAAGAAIATTVAQAFSFFVSLILMKRRKDFPFDFKFKSFRLHRDQSSKLLRLGIPVALQDFSIGISFLLITAFINRIGLAESACVGVTGRVVCTAMLVATAFMSAIAAMSAQNIGADRMDRALSCTRWGVLISFVISAIAVLIVQLFPGELLRLFTDDPDVIRQGILYMRADVLDVLLVPIVFGLNGFFSGCGHTGFSMVNNLISTYGVRVLGTLIVSLIPSTTMFHIGLPAPAASIVQIIIQLFYLRSGSWRKNTVLSPHE